MYHPYFRGKQFELIAIRELARGLADAGFIPIIEPVKESLGGLKRTINEVCTAGGSGVVIVNPYHGDHAEDGVGISSLLRDAFSECENIAAGILLKKSMTVPDAMACFNSHAEHDRVLIHAGFADGKGLAEALGQRVHEIKHVFFESCGMLYRRHFQSASRIIMKDGFERRRNRDYPPVELFSDLHVTYQDLGGSGFGDFLTVGDDYTEGGGPAYAVAIHLTFIDPTKDDQMFIYHFVSDSQDTPTDPAGKFREALSQLITKLSQPNHHIFESSAVTEFRELALRGHFPGLGYVKKLSMKHHVETLADYLA